MSHTPGPWSVEAIYALLRFGRKSGGSWDDIGEEHEFFPDEDDANLIAAAPDMLEALEAIKDKLDAFNPTCPFCQGNASSGHRYTCIWHIANAAIRKARGLA